MRRIGPANSRDPGRTQDGRIELVDDECAAGTGGAEGVDDGDRQVEQRGPCGTCWPSPATGAAAKPAQGVDPV